MKNNCNGCVTGGSNKQKTMFKTISQTPSIIPQTKYDSLPKFSIKTEKSITEPDNGHKTESISPKLADYTLESERLKTFENWKSDVVRPEDLARSGFYCLNVSDRPDLVKCAFCKVEICNWEAGDDALGEHIKWSPSCPHARFMNNAPARQIRTQLGASAEVLVNSVPESVAFKKIAELNRSWDDESKRLESFAKWPKSIKQEPKALAEAGFFYRGIEDHTICFACGGALRDWLAEDNPWEQHAMWFPRCKYLLAKKGPEYIEDVHRRMKHEISKNIITKEEESKSEESANGRSNSPQEILVCKICDLNERNVIFRPCNHCLACSQCSLKLKKCPVCREPIVEKMKVYLS